MKRRSPIALAVAILGLAGEAMAAEVDMSKLTCKEVAAMSPGQIIGVAMWGNGFVHAKAGNVMVATRKAHANAGKVAAYCKKNPGSTLMIALEALSKS
jgi:acid stress chaperone HdeB